MPDELEKIAGELDDGGQTAGRDVQDREDGTPEPVATGEGDGRDEGEGADEQGPDEVEPPQRRPGRRDARIETLLVQREADKERAERLERQVEELRAQRTTQRQESPEEEAARLSLMNPEERSDYKLTKALRQIEVSNRQTAFVAQEAADKAAFDAKVGIDPLYARMQPAVDKTLAELRAQGQNVPREVLFQLEVGKAALAARSKTQGQKDKGAQRVRNQSTPPLNGKGDTAVQRRARSDTPAKRLENVQI
jgi:hypothetical protein